MLLLNGAAATKNLSPHLFNPNAVFTFSNTSLLAILKDNESFSPPVENQIKYQLVIIDNQLENSYPLNVNMKKSYTLSIPDAWRRFCSMRVRFLLSPVFFAQLPIWRLSPLFALPT